MLTGLTGLTRRVPEPGLEAELFEHLDFVQHVREGCDGRNSLNRSLLKMVPRVIGPVPLGVPRDRGSSFERVLVRIGV